MGLNKRTPLPFLWDFSKAAEMNVLWVFGEREKLGCRFSLCLTMELDFFFSLSHISSKRLLPGTAVWETLEKICAVIVELLSRVWLFVTPQTIALQAPLSVGFPRQEYWSGLPCPPPEKICATQMLMYVKHIPEGTPSPAKWADLLNFPTELHRLPTLEQRKWLSYCSITTIHYLLRICHGCLSTSHILSFSL